VEERLKRREAGGAIRKSRQVDRRNPCRRALGRGIAIVGRHAIVIPIRQKRHDDIPIRRLAPRWKQDDELLFGSASGVAATAPLQNAGIALRPTIARRLASRKLPPRKFRPRTPSQHL